LALPGHCITESDNVRLWCMSGRTAGVKVDQMRSRHGVKFASLRREMELDLRCL
jgi:hypothetical protein